MLSRWRQASAAATAVALLAGVPALAAAPDRRDDQTVHAGALRVHISEDPWRLSFTDAAGRPVLAEQPGLGVGPTGTLGFHTGIGADDGGTVLATVPEPAPGVATAPPADRLAGWAHATHVLSSERDGKAYEAVLATTDPLGRTLDVRIAPDGGGVLQVTAAVSDPLGVDAVGVGFVAEPGERFLGFGERSNAVDQRGNTVENFVGEGPYPVEERPFIYPFVPPWGYHPRDDATYFPMPWLLSSRGHGVLVDNPETSYFRLGSHDADAWSLEVEAPRLSFRVVAGPAPADALQRLTERIGRQPEPADPWLFGPTFHVGRPRGEERARVRMLREADAPISAVETSPQYLPCGDHEGLAANEKRRTDFFHAQGLASTAYMVPTICQSYSKVFDEAERRGLLVRNAAGEPYLYRYSVQTRFVVGQLDFTAPGAAEFFGELLGEAVANGHDGWMEDYGEYHPQDGVIHDGTPGASHHNVYPNLYHSAAAEFSEAQDKPIAGFVRSGWTGTAPHAQLVWGGDPTTDWGYDGLSSAVTNGLTMGMSGISRWGSDIGGFFALGPRQLTPELLIRWIQLGSVSGYMKTRQDGVAVPEGKDRPQIWDDDVIGHWKRWATLRTQLYPYLRAADAEYRRTGMPVMRHHALTDPRDPQAAATDDQFRFGPDLLAAPVLEPGAVDRTLYLPHGTWVDLWRTLGYDGAGEGGLSLGSAALLDGGREVTVPAPLDELPLLARAGAVLPLLTPDVDTLSDYGSAPGLVRRADREDELELLAFPRGTSSAAMFEDEALESRESSGRWQLSVDGARERTYRLQASLATLEQPFAPCSVRLDGVDLPTGAWSFDVATSVLRAEFTTTAGRIEVTSCG